MDPRIRIRIRTKISWIYCLGVLLSLVKTSTRLERVQAAFLEQLAVSLHCADALDLVAPLCLRLITKERLGTMEVRRLSTSLILNTSVVDPDPH